MELMALMMLLGLYVHFFFPRKRALKTSSSFNKKTLRARPQSKIWLIASERRHNDNNGHNNHIRHVSLHYSLSIVSSSVPRRLDGQD
jgi:hypothetical protein